MRLFLPALLVVATTVAFHCSAEESKRDAPTRHSVTLDRSLPSDLRWAMDVRWHGESTVAVAAGRAGLVEVEPATGETKVLVPGSGPGSFFHAVHVGSSGGRLLVASSFRELAVKTPRGLAESLPFEFIIDADIAGDRIAIIGAARAESGEWNPEGGVVWRGRVSPGGKVSGLRPLIVADDRGERDPVNRCHFLELGALRYLPDGSLLVVPGVVPGVFLYGSDGRLVHAWDTESLGFEDRCSLTDAEYRAFSPNPLPRWQWINERTVVDEILVLPSGPALVLRAIEKSRTTWSLVHLRPDGDVRREPLPFSSRSTFAHVRGDVRGTTAAFVIREYALMNEPPPAPPRLVIMEIGP